MPWKPVVSYDASSVSRLTVAPLHTGPLLSAQRAGRCKARARSVPVEGHAGHDGRAFGHRRRRHEHGVGGLRTREHISLTARSSKQQAREQATIQRWGVRTGP